MMTRGYTQHQNAFARFGAGYTLIETVVVIALTVMMMLAITTLYISFNRLFEAEQSSTGVAYYAGSAITALGSAILQASHVEASHTFSGTLRTSSGSVLVLKVPTVNASGSIVANTYDYIAFYLSDTALVRVIDANAASSRVSGTKNVAVLLSSISFVYNDADLTKATSITATATTHADTRQGPIDTTLHETFYLRNT